jgi:aspartate/methionine/tyrosine aminotransferase
LLKVGRAAALPPFLAMDVAAAAYRLDAARAPADPHVIHMEVGQPGTPAPAGARRAVEAALRAGIPLGYTDALGRPSLRARIAQHYQDWYGVDVRPERIIVTTGASGAFPLAFLSAFDAGDRVALAAPYYPPYVNILRALGLVPVILPATEADRFQPSVALLERLDPPPAGLIVASPGNPTGTMIHPDEFAAIAAWCHRNRVRLISDEIYHGLHWSGPITTAAAIDGAVVINSFSKYFSMTGWRVGWMVLPEDLQRPVECLAQNFFICAPHVSQVAAEAAFDCHVELQENMAAYRRSRAHLLEALPGVGFAHVAPAEGAFYLFADISDRGEDSVEFCRRMLRETRIATTPGVDFDADRGGRFLRMSYCAPAEDIRAAVERLRKFR